MKRLIILLWTLILLFLIGCQMHKVGDMDASFSPKSIKVKVVDVFDEYSLSVEILETRTDRFKIGDVVVAVFSESNSRAKEIIKELKVKDIIRLHYAEIDNDFEKAPALIKCDGLDVYDANSNEVIIYYR